MRALSRSRRAAARFARAVRGPIVAAPIPTIETLGGGSVRCMLARDSSAQEALSRHCGTRSPERGAAVLASRNHRTIRAPCSNSASNPCLPICSVRSSAVCIVGQLRGGVDIRTLGSGNAGGTNALRTQGVGFAFWVMVIDIGKGWFAAALAARSVRCRSSASIRPSTGLARGCVCGRVRSSDTSIRCGMGFAAAKVRRRSLAC